MVLEAQEQARKEIEATGLDIDTLNSIEVDRAMAEAKATRKYERESK